MEVFDWEKIEKKAKKMIEKTGPGPGHVSISSPTFVRFCWTFFWRRKIFQFSYFKIYLLFFVVRRRIHSTLAPKANPSRLDILFKQYVIIIKFLFLFSLLILHFFSSQSCLPSKFFFFLFLLYYQKVKPCIHPIIVNIFLSQLTYLSFFFIYMSFMSYSKFLGGSRCFTTRKRMRFGLIMQGRGILMQHEKMFDLDLMIVYLQLLYTSTTVKLRKVCRKKGRLLWDFIKEKS